MEDTALQKDVIYFARTNFRGASRLFGVKRKDRRQHMYVVGKSGTGKSVFMHNMIVQDIANGEGLCVVDPHGELIEGVLKKIPEERIKDVVYFNPADPDYAVGFNVLEIPDMRYKHLVAQGLMGIFTKIWSNVWSARMEYILNNAILALVDTPGSTLLGISRLLVDKDYRQKVVGNVKDPVIKSFWINEFEEWQNQYRNEAIAPIQNKVGQFLSSSLVRNIVGQSKSTIDIFDIMNSGKIFLVDVSKGKIGEENSALLGAMIITKIQLAAMERVRIPEEERADFYLYVDEFQNFATDSFASILSEARKYRLNLIIGHQYIGQLITDTSTKVRDSIFGNVGTMVVFRVGSADAEFLESEFEPEFLIQDIVGLPNYNIYLKLMVDGISSRPFSATTLPPFKIATSSLAREKIIESSRKLYANPRYSVEDEINTWTGMAAEGRGKEGEPRRGGGYQPPMQDMAALGALGIEFNTMPGGSSERQESRSNQGPTRQVGRGQIRQAGMPYISQGDRQGFRSRDDQRPQRREYGNAPQQRFERPFVPMRKPSILNREIPEIVPEKNNSQNELRLSDLENQKTKEATPHETSPQEGEKYVEHLDELKNALRDALGNLTKPE